MKDITIDGIIDKFEESSLSELDVTYKELHVICKRYASYPSTEANSITHVQQPIVKEKAQSSTNKLNKELMHHLLVHSFALLPLILQHLLRLVIQLKKVTLFVY